MAVDRLQNILSKLAEGEILSFTSQEFREYLAEFMEVKHVDTRMKGNIYLLRKEDRCFIAESPDQDTIAMREVESLEAGETFVQKRLDTYDRMWDGCGCRIDYFE